MALATTGAMKRRPTRHSSTVDEVKDSEEQVSSQSHSIFKPKTIVYVSSLIIFIVALIFIKKESHPSKIIIIPQSKQSASSIPHDHGTTNINTQTIRPFISVQDSKTADVLLMYPRSSAAANITDFPPTLQTEIYRSFQGKDECNCPVPKEEPKYKAVPYDAQYLLNTLKPPSFNVSFLENHTVSMVRKAWGEYQRRAGSNDSCRSGYGMWAKWTKPGYHKCMARTVGYKFHLKPGDIVLDMGSGCGHSALQWVYWYGVFVVGFDFQYNNVQYANHVATVNNLSAYFYHSAIQSIYLDHWIPNESFDYIHTNAVLMYLNSEEACFVVQKAIQLLKIGGVSWFGWNNHVLMSFRALQSCIASFTEVNAAQINVTWLDGSDMISLMDTCQKNQEYASFIIERIA